jgi:hypothetical protein
MKSKCGVCPRSSSQGDGWWTVHNYKTEPPTVYDLCPSCYRNKSLIAYKETMIEALQEIKITDSDPSIHVAMQVMKQRCMAVVRDLTFND